jgi:hypothetical protein
VSEGSIIINLRSVDVGTTFEIDTPNATVSLPWAGIYRIDVQPSGETGVTVRANIAEVTAGEDAYELSAGQTVDISGSDSITSSTDEWDVWSAGRDRREDWVAANPYVFHEMMAPRTSTEMEHGSLMRAMGRYGPLQTFQRAGPPTASGTGHGWSRGDGRGLMESENCSLNVFLE